MQNRITETETGSESFGDATETEVNADETPQEKSRRIPIHGSFTRPASPEEAVKEMIAGRVPWKRGDLTVTVSTDEFTSLCPTTGMPDFYSVSISYQPDKFYLESKTVKYYFYAYRDFGAHGEVLAQRILEDVCKSIEPKSVRVTVNQSPRGGLRIISEAQWAKNAVLSDYQLIILDEAHPVKLDRSIVGNQGPEIFTPEAIQ